jgi:hypothetical protein
MGFRNRPNRLSLGRIGQGWRFGRTLAIATVVSFLTTLGPRGSAQLVDSLDAYPPRWQLAGSDCNARVAGHVNDAVDGLGGSGCESITLSCGHGTQALLEYRIEPTRVIDELTAKVYVKSLRPGISIGLRVRFPLALDPATGQSVAVILPGASYREAGTWQPIGVGMIEAPLRLKTYALRQSLGGEANLNDPFVDAVVINAYTGPGETNLKIDNLKIDGMVPLVSMRELAVEEAQRPRKSPIEIGATPGQVWAAASRRPTMAGAFPSDAVTRILEHNGEPLDWVKSLGFDAVLLAKPAGREILSEAMRVGVKIYAPPPTAPDPSLLPLLEPLAGFYLGTSMSQARLAAAEADAERIRRWPDAWQRPLILAPAEATRRYAAVANSLVFDLPSPLRGLAATEELAILTDSPGKLGRSGLDAVGIQTNSPAGLRKQLDAITAAIGAPRGPDVFWQATWMQVARSLPATPRAILFRSDRSLTSGRPEDQSRSVGLSYINRYLDAVGGLVAAGKPATPLATRGAPYDVGRLQFPGGQLLIATSQAQHRGLTLAGDGATLRIEVPADQPNPLAWRLTHFAAERLVIERSAGGAYLELVSPDLVETIVLGSDPAAGGRLSQTLGQLAGRAASDRLQLSREGLERLREDWQLATGSRTIPVNRSAAEFVRAADQAMRDAEPMLRSGDAASALRMSRRADAWMLRSQWQLHAALSPGRELNSLVSCPPLLSVGGLPAQVIWAPLMNDAAWGENRLVGGSLDSPGLLGDAGWVVGKRPEAQSASESRVGIVQGPQVEGEGCLVASVVAATPQPLPGGYAGTTLQIRSPLIRYPAKTAIRIDARLRTLGFGGPDQGVLTYDSIGGPELGVLVRATPDWQNVRLYRQTAEEGELSVLFELIGAGEVAIDDVQIRVWSPRDQAQIPLRSLDSGELPLGPQELRTGAGPAAAPRR